MVTVHISQVYDKPSFARAYSVHNNKSLADGYTVANAIPCNVAFDSMSQANMFCAGLILSNSGNANVVLKQLTTW